MRRWYRGEQLPKLAKASWEQLEARFREYVERIPLPDAARAIARPGSIARRCGGASVPTPWTSTARKPRRPQARGDYIDAARTYERLLALDPHDDSARFDLAGCMLRRGDIKEAQQDARRASPATRMRRASCRNRALGALADIDLARGDADRAAQRYAQLARGPSTRMRCAPSR